MEPVVEIRTVSCFENSLHFQFILKRYPILYRLQEHYVGYAMCTVQYIVQTGDHSLRSP